MVTQSETFSRAKIKSHSSFTFFFLIFYLFLFFHQRTGDDFQKRKPHYGRYDVANTFVRKLNETSRLKEGINPFEIALIIG